MPDDYRLENWANLFADAMEKQMEESLGIRASAEAMADTDEPTVTVTKHSGFVPVSCCQLGTCEHPDLSTTFTRRERIRYALRDWWYEHRPRLHFGPTCTTCDHEDCY